MSWSERKFDILDTHIPIKLPKYRGLFICPHCGLSTFDIWIAKENGDMFALCPDCYESYTSCRYKDNDEDLEDE